MDRIPAKYCTPSLAEYGIYRKLNNGNEEFLSYCSKEVTDYTAINKERLEALMEQYLPKEKK